MSFSLARVPVPIVVIAGVLLLLLLLLPWYATIVSLDRVLVFLAVSGGGLWTTWRLLGLYRAAPTAAPAETTAGRWSFEPAALGPASARMLALVSLFGLFLELLLIRWVSSEIRVFAYFKNFVLIACFLGFGLGFHLARRRVQPLALLVPLVLLCVVIELPWRPLRELVDVLPLFLGAFSEVHLWGLPALSLRWPLIASFTSALVISVSLFGLVAMTFIPVGQLIGWQIEAAADGIRAYSVNVLASLAGVLLFSALSFLHQPPLVWFGVATALAVTIFWRRAALRLPLVIAFATCCGLVTWSSALEPGTTYWSPYQKLVLRPQRQGGELVSYRLTTNDTWYQQIVDLSDAFLARHPELLRGARAYCSYDLPYRFVDRPGAVLILGAGMGNDVAGALRNQAARVTAVEIDPVIVQLGRQKHLERPYQDRRVTIVVDDARNYIENADARFDLIVFALLDSHTTASHFTNIRIDNYVYTREALTRARTLLKPDGVFVVKFQVDAPWIAGRLHALLGEVFGAPPLHLQAPPSYSTGGSFFVTGSAARVAAARADPQLATFRRRAQQAPLEAAVGTTDDWPFFYQQAPGLPLVVILLPLMLVLACAVALRRVGVGRGSLNPHFFCLGAGFMLLEVHIISKLALLFGTTWLVNAVVISGILLLVVGANVLVERRPSFPLPAAWLALLATLAVSFVLPIDALRLASPWLRALTATLVLCLPVFFAGIVFIRSFAGVGFSSGALGANLLGALVGGLLESLSLWTGLRAMLLLAAGLYLAAFWFRPRPGQDAGVSAAAPPAG